MTKVAVWAAAAIPCGALVVAGCGESGPQVGDEPLGWTGPVEAREVRQWSRESMDTVPRWTVSESPTLVMVPDSTAEVVYGPGGKVLNRIEQQRYPERAVFLPDRRIVLAYYLASPDSILLHFLDPATGTDAPIVAPRADDGEDLNWGHTGGLAVHDDGIVLLADNAPVGSRRRGSDIWYVDLEGRFTRPASKVNVEGWLFGAFADGSVVIQGRSKQVDTTLVSPVMSVLPLAAGSESSDAHRAGVLFAMGAPGDPARGYETLAGWSHNPGRTMALAGDTIWIVPTERPELLAVHRAGDVVFRIEWDAGDRGGIPAGAPDYWEGAERLPAAASLMAGTDELIYVQRWTVRNDRPVRGPEWLVFSPAGELVARLEVPSAWRVLAFGNGALVAVVYVESDYGEVHVYTFDGAE